MAALRDARFLRAFFLALAHTQRRELKAAQARELTLYQDLY
jgi:hypothetical protein